MFWRSFLVAKRPGASRMAFDPPFRLGKLDEYFARVRRMLGKIGARVLITESRIKRLLGPAVVGVESLRRVMDAKDLQGGGSWRQPRIDPAQPAFLQFSSGSTVEPKALMLSHTNLLANLDMMKQWLVDHDDS